MPTFVYTQWVQNFYDCSLFVSPYSILTLQSSYQEGFHVSSHLFIFYVSSLCRFLQRSAPFSLSDSFIFQHKSCVPQQTREKEEKICCGVWGLLGFLANGAAVARPYTVRAKRAWRKMQPLPSQLAIAYSKHVVFIEQALLIWLMINVVPFR